MHSGNRLCITTEAKICYRSYFHSQGYSQSVPVKMNGASGWIALQTPANGVPISIVPRYFSFQNSK